MRAGSVVCKNTTEPGSPLNPTAAQLMSLSNDKIAILMPPAPPSKADQYGRKWGNHPIRLPVDHGAAINAALALAAWEIHASVGPEERKSNPLLCAGPAAPARSCAGVAHRRRPALRRRESGLMRRKRQRRAGVAR